VTPEERAIIKESDTSIGIIIAKLVAKLAASEQRVAELQAMLNQTPTYISMKAENAALKAQLAGIEARATEYGKT
jgi:hypothetical protein